MNQEMKQEMNQDNGMQTPKKDNTLKIVLIIMGTIFGIAVIGIVGFILLSYIILNTSIEPYKEKKEDIREQYHSSTNDNYTEEENKETNKEEQPNTEEEIIKDEQSDTENDEQSTYSNINKINFTELKKLIKDKRTFIIVITQEMCGHCKNYKKTYNDVLKNNQLTSYELDIAYLNSKEIEEFQNTISIEGTPTTIIYIDGVIQKNKLVGNTDKNEVEMFLKSYGFIME